MGPSLLRKSISLRLAFYNSVSCLSTPQLFLSRRRLKKTIARAEFSGIMGHSSLEVKVISCKDLKAFNFFKKLLVSAVVSIVSDDPDKTKAKQRHLQCQKTPTDKDGGRNPEWSHIMEFDLEPLSLDADPPFFLKFDLRNGSVLGNKSIGEVRVPVKDLIDESNGAVRFVSYQVRSSDGEPNGVLNFSYKVNMKVKTEKSESGSMKFNPSSEEIHTRAEKVQYPSVEVESSSADIRYPSLDDILSPTPIISMPSVGFCTCNQTPVIYNKTLAVSSSLPKSWKVSEVHNHHSHGWSVHTHGAHRFLDATACSNGLTGYPLVGQRLEGTSCRLGPGSGGVRET